MRAIGAPRHNTKTINENAGYDPRAHTTSADCHAGDINHCRALFAFWSFHQTNDSVRSKLCRVPNLVLSSSRCIKQDCSAPRLLTARTDCTNRKRMPALGHSTTDMFQSEVLIDANVPRPEQQTTNAGDDDGDCDVDLWTDIFLEDQQSSATT